MIFQCIQVDDELQSSEKSTPLETKEISDNKLDTQLDQEKSKLVDSKTKTKKVIKKKSRESVKLDNDKQVKEESRPKASENKDVCLVF